MSDLFPLSNRIHLAILWMLFLSVYGCAGMREMLEKSLPPPGYLEEKIERNDFAVTKEDDVMCR